MKQIFNFKISKIPDVQQIRCFQKRAVRMINQYIDFFRHQVNKIFRISNFVSSKSVYNQFKMSILESSKLFLQQNPQESPKCPSAPKLKPFSSKSTLDQEDDISTCHDSEELQIRLNVLEDKKKEKSRKNKKSMLQFLKEKIEMKNIKRHQ